VNHIINPESVINTKCEKEGCKNTSFKNTPFCYWHHPLRKLFYPLGSEMQPRRSLRIALKEEGIIFDFPKESMIE
jgi:hypothetical protein